MIIEQIGRISRHDVEIELEWSEDLSLGSSAKVNGRTKEDEAARIIELELDRFARSISSGSAPKKALLKALK